MTITCPYCGNTSSIVSCTDGTDYCYNCHCCFKLPTSTPTTTAGVSTVSIPSNETNIPNAANADKGFYYVGEPHSKFTLPQENKLTIDSQSITINDDKINITIDNDNVGKFDVIEINGVRFVKEKEND